MKTYEYAWCGALTVFLFVSAPITTYAASCCSCTSPDEGNKVICLQAEVADCGEITSKTANEAVKKMTCTQKLTEAQCQALNGGSSGICQVGPIDQAFYNANAGGGITKALTSTSSSSEGKIIDYNAPRLNFAIPGLTFASKAKVTQGKISVPFMAQYISALYRILVGLAVIAAAIMLVYGGFLVIASSSGIEVSSGKKIIYDALIGLVLVLTANAVLTQINPALTGPGVIKVPYIVGQNGYEDAEAEKARVIEAATPQDGDSGEMSVIDEGEEAPPGKTPSKSQPPQPVKDQYGNFVAQGRCPDDMVKITRSAAYRDTRKIDVKSFCMDRYEAPNVGGQKPYNGVTEYEADWWCQDHGKRLCTRSEWERACFGPNGTNTYGTSATFVPGKLGDKNSTDCNYNSTGSQIKGDTDSIVNARTKKFDSHPMSRAESFFNTNNPKFSNPAYRAGYEALKAELARLSTNGSEPSGSRTKCRTAEGVYDMVGNVQEIVLKDNFFPMTTDQRTSVFTGDVIHNLSMDKKPYTWMNFYWSPVAHLANKDATPQCSQTWGGGDPDKGQGHPANFWRAFENGFRCCISLDEGADAQSQPNS